MVDGYNKPDSRVWHQARRCSGTFFPAMAAMGSQVAKNRGLKPCGTCCNGEWPHTRVGHCRHDEIDFYVGRGEDAHFLNTGIPRRGCLGNPFRVDEHGRAKAVERFRAEFEAQIEGDRRLREFVGGLSGKVLGCWCQRLEDDGPRCHGEVIAEWADRIGR